MIRTGFKTLFVDRDKVVWQTSQCWQRRFDTGSKTFADDMPLLAATARASTVWVWSFLFFCVSTSHAVEREGVLERPVLYWRNGDTLQGSLVAATEEQLSWRSDLFQNPLRLQFEALHMIRFPTRFPPLTVEDSIASQVIETRDGNRFFGRVTSSTDEVIEVDTDLFGAVQLQRSAVGLIANPVERAHVYSGPKGLRGWSTLTYGRKLEEWEEIPSGRLSTRLVAAELYRSLPANGSVDIDIEFLWRNNPSFQVRFLTPYAKPTKETVKLETRTGGYVIQTLGSNGRFRQLETIPKQVTKCRLRMRWNHSASELAVYRGRKYLGKIAVEKQADSAPAGIYIKNTGPQLTLSRLEIRASSTLDITLADPTKDTILLSNNKSIEGEVHRVGASEVVVQRGSETDSYPWSEVAEIAFQAVQRDTSFPSDSAECIFQNGETLKGMLLAADSRRITLKVPAIDKPIQFSLDGIDRIVLGRKTIPPSTGSAFLHANEEKLHGALAATEAGEIAWLPVGGQEPAVVGDGRGALFQLTPAKITTVGGPQDDLAYFYNGDVLPCTVHTAGAASLDLSSRFSARKTLDAEAVSAVELSAEPVPPLSGFDDRWVVDDDTRVSIDPDRIDFSGPATASRESLVNGCDQIAFGLDRTKGTGSVFVHVRLTGTGETRDAVVPFYYMDKKLYVMGSKRNAFIPSSNDGRAAKVVIETHDPFRVEVDGKTVYSIPGKAHGGPWNGLIIEVSDGPLFGIPAVRARRKEQKTIGIRVSDLRVKQTRRRSIRQAAATLNPDPLLTVPRNRRPQSVTHLAFATNHDVIRGNLLRMNARELVMLSKGGEVRFPRSAIAGLVWLANEQAPNVSAKERRSTRVVLKDTTTLSLLDAKMENGVLTGQHPQLGACAVPLSEVQAVLVGNRPNTFHQYGFLGWQARMARPPQFAQIDNDGHRVVSPLIGQPAKLDAVMMGTRERFDLEQYRGRILVLDFWASWCAPCIRNMPKLIALVEQFPTDDVALVAVNQGEDLATVASVLQARGWSLDVAMDSAGSASRTLGIETLPQTVLVNREGNVDAVFLGASDRLHKELNLAIQSLLGE